MGTESFRRHGRQRVDAAVRCTFAQLRHRPYQADALSRVLLAVRQGSDLMDTPPTAGGVVRQLQAVRALAAFQRAWLTAPEGWPGARGHPLRVVDDLARHLVARHPTPRFLASVWFGEPTVSALARRRWYVAHARGRRFRDLDLPIAMTRRMEHLFLHTPDHLSIDHALRRAEVLGVGGSPALAAAVVATRVGRSFEHPDHWRAAIEWLVRVEDDLDLGQVGAIVDYLHAARGHQPLGRLGVASMMRRVAAWHQRLAQRRRGWPPLCWPRSRWRGLVHAAAAEPAPGRDGDGGQPQPVEWRLVELLDSEQLAHEGRVMHHCVRIYDHRCLRGDATIWSLRRTVGDGPARSLLTIEVDPRTATIVQVKAAAYQPASGQPLALVRTWAARERLALGPAVLADLARA